MNTSSNVIHEKHHIHKHLEITELLISNNKGGNISRFVVDLRRILSHLRTGTLMIIWWVVNNVHNVNTYILTVIILDQKYLILI